MDQFPAITHSSHNSRVPRPPPTTTTEPTAATDSQKSNHSHDFQRKRWDVYNYGVVLLEILTGKMAKRDGELGIVKWVQRMGPDESTWEVFDFELIIDREMEEEMRALLQVALLCGFN